VRYLVTNQSRIISDDTPFQLATIADLREYFKEHEFIGLDTETNGFSPYTKSLLLVQVGDEQNQFAIDDTVDIRELKDFFENPQYTFILHNAKFDLKFFYHRRITIKHVFDTFLAEKLLWLGYPGGMHSLALKNCCEHYLGVSLDKTIRGNIIYEGASDAVIVYGCRDVEYLIPLMKAQLKALEEKDLLRAIKLENMFVVVLAYIEYCGVKLDVDKWKAKMDKDLRVFTDAIKALDHWVIENCGDKYVEKCVQQDLFNPTDIGPKCKVNWSSPKQVIELFEELGFNLWTVDKKTKEKKKSVEAKIIKPQQDISPIAELYLTYKGCEKVCSTYGQNFLDNINPISGRLHTQFNQLMDTGRLSSGGGEDKDIGKPMVNLQNLPNDAETRACFVAEPGNLWISADYKGQESVLIANIANDKAMLREFLLGSGDMHSLVAKAIFPDEIDCPVAEIKEKFPHLRKKAKGPEFCFNYGGNDSTLVATYGFDPETAASIYHNYMDEFSGVAAYQSERRKEVMRLGYIEHCPEYGHKAFIYDYDKLMADKATMSAPGFWDRYRVLKVQDPKHPDVEMVRHFFRRKADSEKQSINYPIQARGAICFKRFSIMFFQWLWQNNLLFKVKYCIPVHDEANVEAPAEIAQTVADALVACMRKAGLLFCKTVPLDADVAIGDHWIH
jgi:DNA polymerase-1